MLNFYFIFEFTVFDDNLWNDLTFLITYGLVNMAYDFDLYLISSIDMGLKIFFQLQDLPRSGVAVVVNNQ